MAATGTVVVPASVALELTSRSEVVLVSGTYSYSDGTDTYGATRTQGITIFEAGYGGSALGPDTRFFSVRQGVTETERNVAGTGTTTRSGESGYSSSTGATKHGTYTSGTGIATQGTNGTGSTATARSEVNGGLTVSTPSETAVGGTTTAYDPATTERVGKVDVSSWTRSANATTTTTTALPAVTGTTTGTAPDTVGTTEATTVARSTTTTVTAAAITQTREVVTGTSSHTVTAAVGRTTAQALFWGTNEILRFANYLTENPGAVLEFSEAFGSVIPGTSYLLTDRVLAEELSSGATGPEITLAATSYVSMGRTLTVDVFVSGLTTRTFQAGTSTATKSYRHSILSSSTVAQTWGGSSITGAGTLTDINTTTAKTTGRGSVSAPSATYTGPGEITRLTIVPDAGISSSSYTVRQTGTGYTTTVSTVATGYKRLLASSVFFVWGDPVTLFNGDTITRAVTGPSYDETITYLVSARSTRNTEFDSVRGPVGMTLPASASLFASVGNAGVTYDRPGMVLHSTNLGFSEAWGLGVSVPSGLTAFVGAEFVSFGFAEIGVVKAVPLETFVRITQSMGSVTVSTNTVTSVTAVGTSSFEIARQLATAGTHFQHVDQAGFLASVFCNPFSAHDVVTLYPVGLLGYTSFDKSGGGRSSGTSRFDGASISAAGGAVWAFERLTTPTAYVVGTFNVNREPVNIWRATFFSK